MFTFFHRKPKIVLDAFTDEPTAYACSPIVRASKKLPTWWKDLPVSPLGDAKDNVWLEKPNKKIINNMRRCYGFTELFKKSFLYRNCYDIHVKVANGQYDYYTLGLSPSQHDSRQFGKAFPNHISFKINSPWILREKTGIHFALFGAEWNLDIYDCRVVPGLNTYILPQGVHVNMMLPLRDREYNLYLPIGLPLYHIIPMSEKKVELKSHLVDTNELNKIMFKQAKTFKKFDTLVELAKQNKCPFSE